MTSIGLIDTFAFSAGVATFFAPCAFPLLPGYVSYYMGSDEESTDDVRTRLLRAVLVGLVVSAGFFVVYGILGGIVVALGSQLLANISLLELLVGTILIVLGLAMAAGVDVSVGHVLLPERDRSLFGFFSFGVLYAAAAAGCTAPVFASVAVGALTAGPIAGATTLAAYAAGMSVLMIGVTVATALGRDALFKRFAARTGKIQRAAGVLLVVAGIVQIYLFLFEFGGREMLGI
jgi:cytochrome c-type biogenesis protein